MEIDELRSFCLSLPETEESFPFNQRTLVFKVAGKMFAALDIEWIDKTVNLKCHPELALRYRNEYPELVKPGYHMNKKHWNTVAITELPKAHLAEHMVRHSYELVVSKLPKSQRQAIQKQYLHPDH